MRNPGRILTLLGFLAGCTDTTFNLLPPDGGPPSDTGAMSGAGGTGYAGRPGASGKGGGGSGRSPGSGGTGARGGSGPTGGTGGTAAGDDGGGPDERCAGKPDTPYWSDALGTCIGCRYHCPLGTDCRNDCEAGDKCDPLTNACKPVCGMGLPCKAGQVCDSTRSLCVTCTVSQGVVLGCPPGLKCSVSMDGEECVECITSYDCIDDSKSVCSYNKCRACVRDDECNPSGAPTKVCYGGSCIFPPP